MRQKGEWAAPNSVLRTVSVELCTLHLFNHQEGDEAIEDTEKWICSRGFNNVKICFSLRTLGLNQDKEFKRFFAPLSLCERQHGSLVSGLCGVYVE